MRIVVPALAGLLIGTGVARLPQWLELWVMIPVCLGVVIWAIRSLRQIRLMERECRDLMRALDRQECLCAGMLRVQAWRRD
jgi:hypothetical protein